MKEIASLVPQFFYDMIGRVIPGVLLLWLGALLLVDLSPAAPLPQLAARVSTSILLILGIVLAYLVGALCGALAFAILNWEWTTRPVASIKVEVPAKLDMAKLTKGEIAFLYDALQVFSPAVGARLVKLRAEQHMCSALVAGAIIMIGLCWFGDRPTSSAVSSAMGFAILGGLVVSACLFYVHLAIRARRLLVNCCWLLPELPGVLRDAAVPRLNVGIGPK